MKFYPLTFEPILKDRIWGGTKLQEVLHKNIKSIAVGESWEISTVENDVSVISDGILKGTNLQSLVEKYPIEILGDAVYERVGTQFPLLFKYLDAESDLSIQVHPNDALAKKRHNSLGKTEMWYVMQADEGARIIVGFKKNTTIEEFNTALSNKKVLDLMEEIPVKEGDVFYLETGTIHAIGAGIVLAEIQQTSDVTYRVYDWDRVDAKGNSRELHLDLATEAMSFNKIDTQRKYHKEINKSNIVVDSEYFKTNYVSLKGKMKFDLKDSFIVFMCTNGQFEIHFNNEVYSYEKGETVLIPACLKSIEVNGEATLLEISL